MPLSWLDSEPGLNLGSTITTIQGTDTLSSSRAVINTNFSNLNTDKIEATQTTLSSLASIGTLTTGIWNATTIGVLYGGTGTTTNPQLFGVVLGNGQNGYTVASSTGTSGQFLTSGGSGAYPTWTTSSVDQALSYNFTGTTFRIKNLHASSTSANPLVLNTVSYNTPSGQGNVGTFLRNDGSGNLTWTGAATIVATSTTDVNGISSTATTTLATFSVPADSIGAGNILRTIINFLRISVTNGQQMNMCVWYGTITNSHCMTPATNNSASIITTSGTITVDLTGNGSTGSQTITLSIFGLGSPNDDLTADLDTFIHNTDGVVTTDSTVAQTLQIDIRFLNNSTNDRVDTNNYNAILYR